MAEREIYLVGSVPLASVSDVFETVSSKFGTRIRQIPDGEVGPRSDWITHLEPIFRDHPDLEPSQEVFKVHAGSKAHVRYQPKAGVDPSTIRFGDLGYAENARASYADFRRLREAGRIAPGTRFQVDLVPAHSVIWLFVAESAQASLDPAYNDAVVAEMRKIADAIPHEDLAIQFDIASAVFARLERGVPTPYGRDKAEMVERFSEIIARLADPVPADIPLQFHFCYGDANHKHAIEPTDMGDMVDMANALTARISRPIDLIHMPVPRDRDDDAYFAPLARLKIDPKTRLILGLVHFTDGIEGARRRLATAGRHAADFGIGTECGFGRRDPATIPELLNIHLAAATAEAS